MKIYKRLIVTFVSAVLTVMMIYGGYTIYAADKYTFEGEKFLWSAQVFYREEMNKIFNDKTSAFMDLYAAKGTSAFSDPRMRPPEVKEPITSGPADCETPKDSGNYDKSCVMADKCRKAEDNLSTFCVSVQAVDRFIKYRATLEAIRGNIPIEAQIQVQLAPGAATVVTPALNTLSDFINNREKSIAAEIDNSRKELEAVVFLYDQLVFNWPIHVKLDETKKELITYKNKLKRIRQKIERFPGKFVDATSTKCE